VLYIHSPDRFGRNKEVVLPQLGSFAAGNPAAELRPSLPCNLKGGIFLVNERIDASITINSGPRCNFGHHQY
jgi:hypothetical protein